MKNETEAQMKKVQAYFWSVFEEVDEDIAGPTDSGEQVGQVGHLQCSRD